MKKPWWNVTGGSQDNTRLREHVEMQHSEETIHRDKKRCSEGLTSQLTTNGGFGQLWC